MYSYSEQELDLLHACEVDRVIGHRTSSAVSVTAEPYIALAGCGGAKEAKAAFDQYADGKSGTLYWRIYPELSEGKFYMRLLISDRAPLPEIIEEVRYGASV